MSRRASTTGAAAAIVLMASSGFAQESVYPRLEFHGGIHYGMTRVTRSSAVAQLDAPGDAFFLNGAWLQSADGTIEITTYISERFKVNGGMGGGIWWPIQSSRFGYQNRQTRSAGAALSVATGDFIIGPLDRPFFNMTVGYGGINTSPDAQNFGGYLFNTAVYPGFLLAGAGGGYTGVHLESDYIPNYRQDLVVSLEERYEPLFDLSFGYVGAYNIAKIFEIGGGVVFYHAIPYDREETTPTDPIDPDGAVVYDAATGDTVYYTHRGVKAMARFSLDPRRLLPFGDKLKETELRVYGEAAILGIKNYPIREQVSNTPEGADTIRLGYPRIGERIPIMLGFNAPTNPLVAYGLLPLIMSLGLIWLEPDSNVYDTTYTSDTREAIDHIDTSKIAKGLSYKPARPVVWACASLAAGVGSFVLQRVLDKALGPDRLSVEVEWYGTPYRQDPTSSPLPQVPPQEMKNGHQDDWKWAVSASKTIAGRASVNAKIASDHFRTSDPSWWWSGGGTERLLAPYEWYWELGIGIGF